MPPIAVHLLVAAYFSNIAAEATFDRDRPVSHDAETSRPRKDQGEQSEL